MFFYIATAIFTGFITLVILRKYLFGRIKLAELYVMIVLAIVTFFCIAMAMGQGL